MRILYSFNKKGDEAVGWSREIAAASTPAATFVPFNHSDYIDPQRMTDAVKLDRLHRDRDPGLLRLYRAVEETIHAEAIDVLLVANCPPYHPDFLRTLDVYKVLFSADDPEATYMINIPYLHAYHHVFYVDPAYSADLDMAEKMRYAGMVNADWLPISVFDFECDPDKTEADVCSQPRDIDVVYVGGFWRQKIETLMRVRRALGRRFRLHGYFRLKHNLYLNVAHRYGGWVSPLSLRERVAIYQRSKIGFNIHWNEFGLGNQRLYHLPANGVMQISDCAPHLGRIFALNREVAGYRGADDLIDKLRYYLEHDDERRSIARAGYRRAMSDYRFAAVSRRAAELIRAGMERIGWSKALTA
ncbi:MAG TPA: glycosyltransferase [Vicinamibacterales bacterium]